jgi:hypothetical protein
MLHGPMGRQDTETDKQGRRLRPLRLVRVFHHADCSARLHSHMLWVTAFYGDMAPFTFRGCGRGYVCDVHFAASGIAILVRSPGFRIVHGCLLKH